MADPSSLSRRQLGLLAIGGTVGAGLFISIGDGLRVAGSALILGYLLAAAVAWVVARCIGELALSGPRPRTFVAATASQLGPDFALVQGWSYWATAVLACMAQLTAAGRFLGDLVPALPPWVTGLSALSALAIVNRLPARRYGAAEAWLAGLKVAVLLAFVGWGVLAILGIADRTNAMGGWRWQHHGLRPFVETLPLAFFAFGNSEIVGLGAAETEDAAQVLPSVIDRFMLRLLLLHVFVAAALLALLPSGPTQAVSPFEGVLAEAGFGPAAALMDVVLFVVMISSCNACLFGAGRALDSLADVGAAPRRFGVRNGLGVPAAASGLTIAFVASAITLNALLPIGLLGLILAAASLLGLGNWAIIVASHRRLVGRGERAREAARVPFSGPLTILALAAIAAVVCAISSTPEFRSSALAATIWVTVLSMVAYSRRNRRLRRGGLEKDSARSPLRTP